MSRREDIPDPIAVRFGGPANGEPAAWRDDRDMKPSAFERIAEWLDRRDAEELADDERLAA